jgi:hypothetical protein
MCHLRRERAVQTSTEFSRYAFLFRGDAPGSFTPSAAAFCRVAPAERLSLRAIIVVFVFSRTAVLSVRMSSLVHGRDFVVFFAIVLSVHYAADIPPDRDDLSRLARRRRPTDEMSDFTLEINVIIAAAY